MTEIKESQSYRWQNAVIVLVALLAYLPALRNGFVFDDWILLIQNPLVSAADGLHRIWFTTQAPDYYPVTWSLWWLQWRLWGANPLGYHVVNLVLHAVNAVLIARVLRRLEVRGAWLAALIFALHPVNVAAVAWISEQKTTLSMLFFLITVLAYLRFNNNGKWNSYIVSIVAFLFSLLTKPAAIMWPVVLIGLVWWKRRVTRRDLALAMPYVALSMVIAPLTVWFQAVRVLEGQPARAEGFLARLAGAGWAAWFYLGKVLFPLHLSMIYPQWNIDPSKIVAYVPGLLLVVLLVCCWIQRHTWGRDILAGVGYFLVMLFPVLGFFDQGFYRYSLVSDHWQYMAIIGVIALVVSLSTRILDKYRQSLGLLARVTATVVVVVLGVMTWNQSRIYFSEETLWRDTITKNPNAWLAHYNLGVTLAAQGQSSMAIDEYQAALRVKPDYADALNNLAMAELQQGRVEEALGYWQSALHYQLDDVEVLNNLGATYARQSDLHHAALYFSLVLILKPEDVEAHMNLGTIYINQHKMTKAVEQFQAVTRIDPSMPQAWQNLGFALANVGRFPEAIDAFQHVLHLDPTNPAALDALQRLERQPTM